MKQRIVSLTKRKVCKNQRVNMHMKLVKKYESLMYTDTENRGNN